MSQHTGRAALARHAAVAGGDVAVDLFRTGVAVERKSEKTDVVTEADRAAQRRVAELLAEEHPDETLVGEEEDALKEIPDGTAWVVDPIDGTNNYVRELPTWATAVACVVDGEPVAAANALPALGDVYTADGDAAYRNGHEIAVTETTDPEPTVVVPPVSWSRGLRA